MTRAIFLLFALAVAAAVFVPALAQAPVLAVCDKGLCVITEAVFDRLFELAKKAGKTCL